MINLWVCDDEDYVIRPRAEAKEGGRAGGREGRGLREEMDLNAERILTRCSLFPLAARAPRRRRSQSHGKHICKVASHTGRWVGSLSSSSTRPLLSNSLHANTR